MQRPQDKVNGMSSGI